MQYLKNKFRKIVSKTVFAVDKKNIVNVNGQEINFNIVFFMYVPVYYFSSIELTKYSEKQYAIYFLLICLCTK